MPKSVKIPPTILLDVKSRLPSDVYDQVDLAIHAAASNIILFC